MEQPVAPPIDPAIRDLIARMPKAELHLHLDGSLRPATALQLARQRRLDRGMDRAAMRRALTAPMPCVDQAQLLAAFELPIALLQDAEALERVTHELVEDVATDGTRYVEIRWAPSLHVRRGLSLREGIAAVVAGARSGSQATGVVARLIAVALRTLDPDDEAVMARTAADFLGDGLTGFDCAGREAEAPDPTRFAAAFAIARDAGLGITVHAGEWGGAAQVWRALDIEPTRIAHGAPAADDPALMAQLRTRGVTLDLCPTSNVQASIVGSLAAHPLARLHRAGVPVTLSTDDRTVSDLTLTREYEHAVEPIGLSPAELWAMDRHALEVAFLQHDEQLRADLLAGFDTFAADEPLLRP
ncbi:MAG: adenosine deaminase [Chloroflexi bacterium]|nr:adenosine deaminase [Chloroflexota bacterium]